jgi:hypothetical protein
MIITQDCTCATNDDVSPPETGVSSAVEMAFELGMKYFAVVYPFFSTHYIDSGESVNGGFYVRVTYS